jgi:hypothetical protein
VPHWPYSEATLAGRRVRFLGCSYRASLRPAGRASREERCGGRRPTDAPETPRPGAILGWSMRRRSPWLRSLACKPSQGKSPNWNLRPALTIRFSLGAQVGHRDGAVGKGDCLVLCRRIECSRNFFPRLTWCHVGDHGAFSAP